MAQPKSRPVLAFMVVLALAILACNAVLPSSDQAVSATVTVSAAVANSDLPGSEAAVERVSLDDAKAALDAGTAIFLDVRDASSFQTSHIAGAISIPLDVIESNPAGVPLEKDQWIITYCS